MMVTHKVMNDYYYAGKIIIKNLNYLNYSWLNNPPNSKQKLMILIKEMMSQNK